MLNFRSFVWGSATIVLAFFSLPSSLPAPVEVRNGGDTVYCRPDSSARFSGHYPLDYVIAFLDTNPSRNMPRLSWQQYMGRIQSNLAVNSPMLHQSFREFYDLLFNTDATKSRIWRSATFGLTPLDDEDLIEKLPPNCYELTATGEPSIIQTIIREKRRGTVIYNYDPQILRTLRAEPSHLSYLLVHEWLWDYASSARVVRNVTEFLHSESAMQLSPHEFERALERLGLYISGDENVGQRSLTIEPWGDDGNLFVIDPPAYYPANRYKLTLHNQTPYFLSVYSDSNAMGNNNSMRLGMIPPHPSTPVTFDVIVPGTVTVHSATSVSYIDLTLEGG